MNRYNAGGAILQAWDYPSISFDNWRDATRIYPLTPCNQAAALSTELLVASRTYSTVFWTPNRTSTLDFLAIEVTAAVAASSVDIAIYDGGIWMTMGAIGHAPRLYQTTALATATTGVKSVNPALALEANHVYLATVVTSAHAITARSMASVQTPGNMMTEAAVRRAFLSSEPFASGVQGATHTRDTSSLSGRPITTTLQADRTPFTHTAITTNKGPVLFGRFA